MCVCVCICMYVCLHSVTILLLYTRPSLLRGILNSKFSMIR